MVAPRFTPEEDKQISEEYLGGSTVASLARKHNTYDRTINNALKRVGVEKTKSPKAQKLTSREIDDAAIEYQNSNVSVQKLAERLGVRANTLRDSFIRRGIYTPKRFASKEDHGNWKGGRTMDARQGYIKVRPVENDPPWIHRWAGGNYIMEHRYVMAKFLGRPLTSNETVHHIDGDRQNNALENLQLRRKRHGKGSKFVYTCCGSEDIKEVPLED